MKPSTGVFVYEMLSQLAKAHKGARLLTPSVRRIFPHHCRGCFKFVHLA